VRVDTEVRYGGVIVGRSPQIRDRDDAGAFLVFGEPLPVGTPIVIKLDEGGREQHARVTDVVESADASAAGMRVRFVSEAERSGPHRAAKPTPAPVPVAAPPAAETPRAAEAPQAAAPVVAAVEASQPSSSPVPVAVGGGEGSTGSQGVQAGESSAHHVADPNAAHHHDGEGGRRRRRRK
jgi:hypothetical protein